MLVYNFKDLIACFQLFSRIQYFLIMVSLQYFNNYDEKLELIATERYFYNIIDRQMILIGNLAYFGSAEYKYLSLLLNHICFALIHPFIILIILSIIVINCLSFAAFATISLLSCCFNRLIAFRSVMKVPQHQDWRDISFWPCATLMISVFQLLD